MQYSSLDKLNSGELFTAASGRAGSSATPSLLFAKHVEFVGKESETNRIVLAIGISQPHKEVVVVRRPSFRLQSTPHFPRIPLKIGPQLA